MSSVRLRGELVRAELPPEPDGYAIGRRLGKARLNLKRGHETSGAKTR
ncbi:MAG TPA: hypothetical protein VMA77_20195 [Solirubrobacteraceae bacterium]|nr:hypothetical protein [Solirubrobacteraceae bacterium]